MILHRRADETVPFADSEELVRNRGLPLESLIEVGTYHLDGPVTVRHDGVVNQLYGGNGKILSGTAVAGTVEGNQVNPLGDAPRPKPPVPSIYEWQQKRGER